jgi:hypothetical protein
MTTNPSENSFGLSEEQMKDISELAEMHSKYQKEFESFANKCVELISLLPSLVEEQHESDDDGPAFDEWEGEDIPRG